ncbi:DUF1178 family protein [Sphingobium lignivorans]|uniref:DUF1178 family protein n=1 Tax=Sphingobium lignivorans TaxID=2735886 RepID=A0ABR6NEY0_9SPHN|nr:DUF1178 family protein [Sphingobium lignivorans]MBB5985835.1 hypothetical protein [Sphingobium lignivorans]
MISFDLQCSGNHIFEGWFRSGADYEEQRRAGQIHCPTCGCPTISKAVMAPAVAMKGNRHSDLAGRSDKQPAVPQDPQAHAERVQHLLDALASAQAEMLKESRWVGADFAEQARAIHYGEAEPAILHGVAKPADAKEMMEEGIPIAPLLVPIAPPDELH